MTIEHREKIGLGLWDKDSLGTALNDVDRLGFDWHYNWGDRALWDADTTTEQSSYTAMIWDEQDVTAAALARAKASASTLLGFNEPDHPGQANMSVAQALALWPQLEATGLRLGSPAPTQHEVLGEDSWLGRFMAGAESKGLRVDFIAVHYYSEDKDIGAFKAFLEAVHEQYGKPVWVTEWALADWDNEGRFSAAEQAAFARAGAEMMDDLGFVEHHAWFAAYEGGDGWDLNSSVFDASGNLTAVGRVFEDLLDDSPSGAAKDDADDLVLVGTSGANTLTGGAGADTLKGLAGNDKLTGGGAADTLVGGAGADVLAGNRSTDKLFGNAGNDTLTGGDGNDVLVGGTGRDVLTGGAGADRFDFNTAQETLTGSGRDVVYFSRTQRDRVDLSGIDADTDGTAGNQGFRWVDAGDLDAAFTGVDGQLRFAGGILMGDTNGDRKADFEIKIIGSLTAADLVL